MFDDYLRALKDRLMAPLARALGRVVHPDVVTLAAFAMGLGAAFLAAAGRFGWALGLWLVNRTLDGLDGSIARARGAASDFGGYLDIVLDLVVYAAIPIGIVLADPTPAALLAALVLVASFYVNAGAWMMLTAILERRGRGAPATGERTTVTMPPGIIAGTETLVFYTAFLLVPRWAVALFWILAALVLMSAAQRVWWARRHL